MLSNGTVVDRAVAATDPTNVHRDRLRVRLETTLADALSDDRARPSMGAVNSAVDAARGSLRDRLQSTVEAGLESEAGRARKRVLGERLGSIPAGLPVAPLPGAWYATVNVWYVEIGGTYERFAVRTDRGDPTGAVTYLRDGRVARITRADERLRLGSSARVSFRTETAIVVAIPAGGRGVGDTGGIMDERSPGWPPG